jgi:hypothetical protein
MRGTGVRYMLEGEGTVMDLTQMRQRADADLRMAQAEAAVADAEAEKAEQARAAAHARLAEMQSVSDWIEKQDGSTEPAAPGTEPRMRFGRPVPGVTQGELCLRVLAEMNRPMTAKQIRDRLAEEGHEFDSAQIRTALKYISRKGKVMSAGQGLWQLPGPRSSARTIRAS